MQIQQANWLSDNHWQIDALHCSSNGRSSNATSQTTGQTIGQTTANQTAENQDFTPQLVLIFGDRDLLKTATPIQQLRQTYPTAYFMGCSTAGEIYDVRVQDHSLTATAIEFATTQILGHHIYLEPEESSFSAGARLAQQFVTGHNKPKSASITGTDLVHIFVLSDGLSVNGSDLIKGLASKLPPHVTITGGLSGDGSRFSETLVLSDQEIGPNMIAAVGFYGANLHIGYGSIGGWTTFGPKRIVTKSKGNVLYELDGQSAVGLYKKYLGEYAAELPSSGLRFPLHLYNNGDHDPVVRTILAVDDLAADETQQSLTFAGDVPEGSVVQLMQTNSNRLVDGAMAAAQNSLQNSLRNSLKDSLKNSLVTSHSAADAVPVPPQLAILISCVGRKLVLKQRTEEEVEGVREVIGADTVFTGFYSYGEIAPSAQGKPCELHNQTMTITTFTESHTES